MDGPTRRLLRWSTILAATLHTLTDAWEWLSGGFSTAQLLLNYIAFLPMPVILVGLYAAQRPRISRLGLWGAVAYGAAFVYFAHTTLVALEEEVATYAELWGRLGDVYTAHGALMVLGGAAFGWASFRAGIFPRWTAALFLAGIATNFALALLPLPELFQTFGTALRNAGLVGMGWAAASRSPRSRNRV
jgi:hypothetical protein